MKHFLPRLLNYLGILKFFTLKCNIVLKGKKFVIPVINGMGLRNIAVHENWMSELISKLIKLKRGAIIDVGANLGEVMLLTKSLDRDIPYIGFEPSLHCCYYNKELIKENNFKNTEIIPVALNNKSEIRKFFIRHAADTGATLNGELRPGFYTEDQVQIVPTLQLDELDERFGIKDISIIKIDVEGGELEVIEGMKKTVTNCRPFIVCEVLDYYSNESKENSQFRVDKLLKMINGWNYYIYKIFINDNDSISRLEPIDNIELKKWVLSSRYENDYLFCPFKLEQEDLVDIIGS